MAKNAGADVVARGADVPLALQAQAVTRDALVDPQPGDIIPDLEEKGYHVGTVRQPAEPVLTRAGAVGFESTADEPSKFTTYKEDFDALEARVQADPAYAGTVVVPISGEPDPNAEKERLAAAAPAPDRRQASRQAALDPVGNSPSGATVVDDLDADSAAVASSQAADDKRSK